MEYGYETKFDGYDLGPGAELADVSAAVNLVEATLKPCPAAVIGQELLRLKLRTKNRAQSEHELAFQIAIYADDLADYPQDVVVDALRYWAKNEKWWPAWAELKPLLDDRVERRRALIKVLRRVPRSPPPQIDRAREQQEAESDPDIWFWHIMAPYIRRRLPDQRATALITAWQCGDADAIRAVDALNRERKLREAQTSARGGTHEPA